MNRLNCIAVVLGLAAASSATQAAVVTTEVFNNTSRTFFPVLNNDLIDGVLPTVTDATMDPGFVPLNSSFTIDNITDGSNSNSGGSIVDTRYDAGESAVGTLMYELTFDLDTSVNALGYDISSIISTTNGSDERVNQDIEIFFSFVGDGGFTSIDRNLYAPRGNDRGDASAQVTFTDTTGLLGSGVDAVRFRTYLVNDTLLDGTTTPSPNGATVFSEFDVVAIATVPEPTSALAGLAGLAMLAMRQRSR